MVQEYNKNSLVNSGDVMLFFYASYNSNCSINKEILERLCKDFPNISFFKINTTAYHSVKSEYEVTRIPTYLFLKDGNEISRITGNSSSYVLKNFINENI